MCMAIRKVKYVIAEGGKTDYTVVEYKIFKTGYRGSALFETTNKTLAKKKLLEFANKKQTANIILEAKIAEAQRK